MKKWTRLWAVSLIVMGGAAVLLAGSRIAGAGLPDAAVRTLGVIDLIALPVFAFASVRVWSEKRRS